MGRSWSRSTNAAASRALYLCGAAGGVVGARDTSRPGVGAAGGLAAFFFLPVETGSDVGRFFLAVMVHLRGRQLAAGGARCAAVPGEEDYLDRAAGSRQFPLTSPRLRTRRLCHSITVPQPDVAWPHAAVGANAVAARPSRAPPPRSKPAAARSSTDRAWDVRGTAVVPGGPGRG